MSSAEFVVHFDDGTSKAVTYAPKTPLAFVVEVPLPFLLLHFVLLLLLLLPLFLLLLLLLQLLLLFLLLCPTLSPPRVSVTSLMELSLSRRLVWLIMSHWQRTTVTLSWTSSSWTLPKYLHHRHHFLLSLTYSSAFPLSSSRRLKCNKSNSFGKMQRSRL